MFYIIVLAIFFYVSYEIYIFAKKKVLFPLKSVYLWIVFKRTIQFGLWFMLFYILGAIQPWLHEENLSSLSSANGTLEIRCVGRNNNYYLKEMNGEKTEFYFNLTNILKIGDLSNYDNQDVVLRHSNRFVYQMETTEGEVVFSVDSTNHAVWAHNQIHALLYILLFVGWFLSILRSIN